MAGQLYEALRVPVMEAEALQRRCYFGGHSLGGSLALLLAVLFRLRLPLPPHLLRCCTFGSPPVLSHGGGRGGSQVLQVCCPLFFLSEGRATPEFWLTDILVINELPAKV